MGFWISLLIMDRIMPFTMIGLGRYFKKQAPKEIINCVKDTVLPLHKEWFQSCNANLDTYYQTYGEKDACFCECSGQSMMYV